MGSICYSFFFNDTATTEIYTLSLHDALPISLALDRYLDGACVPAFATYTGEDFDTSEDLTIGYFYPSRDGWDSGDRTVTCYIVRSDEAKLTESVKAATGS